MIIQKIKIKYRSYNDKSYSIPKSCWDEKPGYNSLPLPIAFRALRLLNIKNILREVNNNYKSPNFMQDPMMRTVINGDWEIAIVGDKMSAKQIKNNAGATSQISFNATRQP